MSCARALCAAVLAAMLLASCQPTAEEPAPAGTVQAAPTTPPPPTATATPEPTQDPTEDPVDPTVIPDEITEDYLNAVFVELEEAYNVAVKELKEELLLVPEADDAFKAIYEPERLQATRDYWTDLLVQDPQLSGIAADPGPRQTVTLEIVGSHEECVFVRTERSYDEMLVNTQEPEIILIRLRRHTPQDLINPTPWRMDFEGRLLEDVAYEEDLCAGS